MNENKAIDSIIIGMLTEFRKELIVPPRNVENLIEKLNQQIENIERKDN